MSRIHDVKVRNVRVNTDERGHLAEVFRSDWDEYDIDPEMSYYLTTYLGVVRAWHRHLEGQIDHFVCPKGRITGESTMTVITPRQRANLTRS